MTSDILKLPVQDIENPNKTLKDLISECIFEEIEDYSIIMSGENIKSCSIKTKNNKYKFISGSYYDLFISEL